MLSKPLILFASILTMLSVRIAYFTEPVAAQQIDEEVLIRLPPTDREFDPNGFVVYGRAPAVTDGSTSTGRMAGLVDRVVYEQVLDPPREVTNGPKKTLPDLEPFFELGGTLELLTTDSDLRKHDIVISEIMWGRDTSYRIETRDPPLPTDPSGEEGRDLSRYTQWIELYNNTDQVVASELFFLFTPFQNHPNRETVVVDDSTYRAIDAVSTLDLGKWELPGKSGRRPYTNIVSAYRDIRYPESDHGRAVVPFGSYEDSWKATEEEGRRNTLVSVPRSATEVIRLPYIATPGAPHVPDVFLEVPSKTDVRSNKVVINEVRNDTSSDNLDWVELKNVGRSTVELEDWELSVVTGVGQDKKLAALPDYPLAAGEILLLQREEPYQTTLADGINIAERVTHPVGARHKYFVATELELPNTGKFVLLLRSESGKNGQDVAIEDYAGNGFHVDTSFEFNTKFWPRKGQPTPTDVADFGDPTFGAVSKAWARLRYDTDDGHHEEAWEEVGIQGGIGYAPGADRSISPGTPGYENDAIKTHIDDGNPRTPAIDSEYDDGEISISEIMYDPGPTLRSGQWIEIYNSSFTQAVNLKDWKLEIRNLEDDVQTYTDVRLTFEEAIILPNQTLLLVFGRANSDVPSNRIYDIYREHRRELGLTSRSDLLLSPTAFYLKITDSDNVVVDQVGNLKVERRERSKIWDLPEINPERRRSILRVYGEGFGPGPPADGRMADGWRQFPEKGVSFSYYGLRKDRASPGYRRGSPLPVALSSFRPVRMETGEVRIEWRTESELNNAGFNILRSEHHDRDFRVINLNGIIPGHGTSSEQHLYSYTDRTARHDVPYYYQIADISFDGKHRTLATVRLKGHIAASDKRTITWGNLKKRD